jgi:hypothetical protein
MDVPLSQISDKQPSGLALTNGSAGGHENNDEKYGQQEKYSNHQPSPLSKFFTPILPANILRRNRVFGFLPGRTRPTLYLILPFMEHKVYQPLRKGLSSITIYNYS